MDNTNPKDTPPQSPAIEVDPSPPPSPPPALPPAMLTPSHLTGRSSSPAPAPTRPDLFTLDSLRSDQSPFSSSSKSHTAAASPSMQSQVAVEVDPSAPPSVPPAMLNPSHLVRRSSYPAPAPTRPNLFSLDSLLSDQSPFSSSSKSNTAAASPSMQLRHPSVPPPPPPHISAAEAAAVEAVADPPWFEYTVEKMLRWCNGKNTSFPQIMELNMGRRITYIQGVVYCNFCNMNYVEDYDVAKQLGKVLRTSHDPEMKNTKLAPVRWCEPIKHRCRICKRKKVTTPVIATKKKEINFLFLFSGQDLGLCSPEQLKYFMKHNRPAGAPDPDPFNKQHLLFCCYKEIVMQLWSQTWTAG